MDEPTTTLTAQRERRVRSKSLTSQHRSTIIEMFARGYTVRRIRNYLTEELERVPSDSELLRIAVEHADDIDQAREEIAELALTRGLASKEERVYRLRELAESWEDSAHDTSNAKAAGVYLSTLKQIREEVEPLGILIRLPAGDPWGQLLTEIRDSAIDTPKPELGTGQIENEQE